MLRELVIGVFIGAKRVLSLIERLSLLFLDGAKESKSEY